MTAAPLVVVGIGVDGWPGLGEAARAALRSADEIVGSERQLALLPALSARLRPWPSPMGKLLEDLLAGVGGRVCLLSSGDPMLHGVGATLARTLPAQRQLIVHPHPSAFALACARLGWPAAEVELVSAVARAPEIVARLLQPRRRLIAYCTGASGASELAGVLNQRGFGPSRFIVCEQLGGPAERIIQSTAETFRQAADPLHCVAIECRAAAGTPLLPLVAGLPDEAYDSDGQLTKRHVRAITLAALAPTPQALLWDVGAGSGSISIEWLRAEASAGAIAIEPRPDRADRIEANALRLGVPALRVIRGRAPQALKGLPAPNAAFIGGGLTCPDVIERCWQALAPGGRIVANAVTLESEQVLVSARAAYGGQLTRIAISHSDPLGSFQAWRAQLPVVQWGAQRSPP